MDKKDSELEKRVEELEQRVSRVKWWHFVFYVSILIIVLYELDKVFTLISQSIDKEIFSKIMLFLLNRESMN